MSTLTIHPTIQPIPTHATTRSQVRLTRRGRLVVFLVSLVAVLATAFFVLGGSSVATDKAGTSEPTRVVMVGSGETLWGIAAEIADDGEVREMVTRIERLNALDSAMVYAGQRLRVPVE